MVGPEGIYIGMLFAFASVDEIENIDRSVPGGAGDAQSSPAAVVPGNTGGIAPRQIGGEKLGLSLCSEEDEEKEGGEGMVGFHNG